MHAKVSYTYGGVTDPKLHSEGFPLNNCLVPDSEWAFIPIKEPLCSTKTENFHLEPIPQNLNTL